MTAQNPPLAITLDSAGAAAQHPAASFRRLVELLAGGQSGVRSATDLAVTANATPNMTTTVTAGEAIIPGTEQPASQGAYYVWNDAAVVLTHAAANGTNPRRDLVVARVYDRDYSGTTGAWALEIVAGTPAASPVDPATPPNSIVLARVTVRAATASILTSDITDMRTVLRSTPPRYQSRSKRYVTTKATSSTVFVDVDAATAEVTIVKQEASTLLRLQVACVAYQSGAAGRIEFGLLVNGTDRTVGALYAQVGVAAPVVGIIDVAGLPAGTYPVRLRWRTTAGTVNTGVNEQLSFAASEVP